MYVSKFVPCTILLSYNATTCIFLFKKVQNTTGKSKCPNDEKVKNIKDGELTSDHTFALHLKRDHPEVKGGGAIS